MASKEQKDLMKQFYEKTGFEFMEKEKAKANYPVVFLGLWNNNIQWMRDLIEETDYLINDYRNKV